jgi:threonine/homoserine/homoserine lactone efflux protein
MAGIEHLGLFIVAGLLLNLTPGPDVLYIVTHALRSGARTGIMAGLGITAGCFVHTFAAALGVGALLATSASAFGVLKWAGAAYLLTMGVKLLLSRAGASPLAAAAQSQAPAADSLWRVFTGGFWTNVLNPKVAIFFLAFVPQFIAPGAANPIWLFLALGVLFNVNALPVNIGWALAAAWMARRASLVQRGMHWLDRVAGVLFMGFALKLALTDNPSQ